MPPTPTLTRLGRALAPAALLAACLAPASAADVKALPRTIAKEPAYVGKPEYCLLVFGSDLATRVWLVLDGDTAYIDRNGNGDLTEPSEKVGLPGGPEKDGTEEWTSTQRLFELGDMPAPAGTQAPYTGLTLHRFTVTVQGTPGAVRPSDVCTLSLLVRDSHSQSAKPVFAAKAAEAPIVHIDGPLEANVATACNGTVPELTQGAQDEELTVQIGTVGLGVWSSIGYEQVPEDVLPVLEITWPGRAPGQPGPQTKQTLDHRC